ncbi:MAG: EAL domain-containing protein [gamma proteobacterium symbiont of Bathyaustriella thionipta]|nr:EAL domain-containing protein [gamma proteobacterium symbiont of Bathyaustriella thionipta]MCU7951287.1 EAL domain-containing protein [gamma proteobacterium symbiont of Bathyaustriella thionipta]MCU7954659.1 EAL domain-containing protein [gamma proteobacterium symbiont of Bathyaustriella thionipta]MCU7957828.1 EAL domain-containing protein [gamma proteobacterium symbiont of Bathyaustriella thionipta]MCU7967280.1 EAL domain-containing protein [gamma proteobacterium symbiont of Bathyaustriella
MKLFYTFLVLLLITSHSTTHAYSKTLKSASELDYPPFAIVTHDNQADGFSVELLKSVTQTMGLDVTFHINEWNIIKNSLKAGNLDVLPLVGRTPEREAYFDFTIPYLSMHGTVIVRNDNTAIKTLSDLSEKKLLVMSGDNAHEYLLRSNISQHIIETKSFEDALKQLSAGQYDGVVIQKLVAIQLIKHLKLANLKPVDFILKDLRQDFCFAVQEGDKALLALLNEGLSIVMANGTYEQHYNKWFSFLIEEDSYYQKVAYLLIAITIVLLILISFSIIWHRTLQYRIDKKTKALGKSEQLLQNVIVGANLGFWDWYYQTGNYCVSKRWLTILGLEQSDLKNHINDYFERIHKDDYSSIQQVIQHAIMEDIPYRVEFRMRHHNGSWTWIEGSGRVIERDTKTGKPIRLCGTHQDITDRIQVELKQKEDYEKLQLLLENINGISWELDLADNTFTYISPNAERILGYPLENWADVDSWISMVIPEDREYASSYCQLETASGRDHNFEYRMQKKNGDIIWVFDMVTVIKDAANQAIKLACFILDNSEQKNTEKRLRQKESEQRAILSAIPDLMFVLDAEGRYINVWTKKPSKLAASKKLLLGNTISEILDTDSSEKVMAALKEADAHGYSSGQIINLKTPEGNLWFELSTSLKDRNVSPHQFIMLSRDITQRIKNEERLKLAASVFAHASEGILITDIKGNIVEVNSAFTEITGYSRAEVLGKNPSLLNSGRQDPEFYTNMWHKITTEGYWTGEIWNKNKNCDLYIEQLTISTVQNKDDETQHYLALFTDITKQKQHQQQLEYIAHYDALTNLPNRLLLTDRIHQALIQAQRRQCYVAIAFLDLDGFKSVNDNHGHSVGDQLLATLSSRMQHVLREGDTIARLGGDEFVVVLNDLAMIEDSIPWLTRLLSVTAEAVNINQLKLHISASIGVTFYPQDEDAGEDKLLRQADQAMYQAKLKGKNRYHLFDAVEDRNVRGYHEDIKLISAALKNNEFVLFYQPKVNMRSGTVIGAEALIRWQHPEQGLLPPNHFLPIIENHLLSVELGEWVIDKTLCQMEEWHRMGLDIEVSINISAIQLQQANFTSRLFDRLADSPEVKPDNLLLEILETSALEDIFHVSQAIQSCSQKGIKFALDDFGTGYSSLTYLKRLPVTQLKIDQTFVLDMLDDPENLAILEGILSLAKAFNHQIIAEGVETIEHGEMLLHLGAELAQGYAIAHPLPAADLPDWIQTWKPDPLWPESRTIHSADVPLLFASSEHRAWIRTIEV